MSIFYNWLFGLLMASLFISGSVSIVQYCKSLRLSKYSAEISEIIQIARVLALMHNQPIKICSSVDGRFCEQQKKYNFILVVEQDKIYKSVPIDSKMVVYKGFGGSYGVNINISPWGHTHNHGTFFIGQNKLLVCLTINKAVRTYQKVCGQ